MVLVSLLAAALAGQPTAAPTTPPAATPPAANPSTVKATSFSSADELLYRLEEADKSIRSLQADIQYSKRYSNVEGGDKQIWRGKLFFDVPAPAAADGKAAKDQALPPKRRFAVMFDELLIPEPDGKQMTRRQETKHLIFDGEWFVERNSAAKQFNKRRVVKPGERIDPLRLGEGPFPLPIGQKRDEIVRRFKAELLPFDAGMEELPQDKRERFKDSVQLRLTPIVQTREARELAEVRIWYRLSDLLPRLAKARTAEGAETEILLINHAINQPIQTMVFNTDPPAEKGWDVSIRDDFRAPAENPGDEALDPPAQR